MNYEIREASRKHRIDGVIVWLRRRGLEGRYRVPPTLVVPSKGTLGLVAAYLF